MAVNTSEAEEILQFLQPSAFANVKAIAMEYFLGLTGSEEGIAFIGGNEKYLSAIVGLVNETDQLLQKNSLLALVNLSAKDEMSIKLSALSSHPNFLHDLVSYILKPDSPLADLVCILLSNLSRVVICAHRLVTLMVAQRKEVGFDKVIQAFCRPNYNATNKLHYIGPFLSNLTQIPQARKYILDKEKLVIQRLLTFTTYEESSLRRAGIVGAIKNCCFETEYHSWLLGPDVDILPRLLLPLAGPEEFDDDDMDKLPVDLQYLEPDKEREDVGDIRKMLVEAVMQMCSQKKCRDYIKEKNTYAIMRELHKWEKEPEVKSVVEAMVQMLIADEPEKGMENLNEVEIPSHIEEKLEKAKEDERKEIEQEKKDVAEGKKAEESQ